MTENEAIEILKTDSCIECIEDADSPIVCEYGACRVAEATRIAIKALEEVQQYRAIGTPEDCRAAVEKQTAKRPLSEGYGHQCPICDNYFDSRAWKSKYCGLCGQKLDWSDVK